MATSIIIEKIKEVEAGLRIMRDTEAINKATYATLAQGLDKIKTEYAQLHGTDVIRMHHSQTKDKQLPLLAQAAGILLTIRTALPVAGNADTTEAETAITSALQCLALQVEQVMNTTSSVK